MTTHDAGGVETPMADVPLLTVGEVFALGGMARKPGDRAAAPVHHGLFAKASDAHPPIPDEHQAHFDTAFDAGWKLIADHEYCECDRIVLMWRAVYAVAAALVPAAVQPAPAGEASA